MSNPQTLFHTQGLLANVDLATTATYLTDIIVSDPMTSGLVFYLYSDQNANFVIKYMDSKERRRTLQTTTAYVAGTLTRVNFAHFVRKAYIEWTPASAAHLDVEAWSYGRSFA